MARRGTSLLTIVEPLESGQSKFYFFAKISSNDRRDDMAYVVETSCRIETQEGENNTIEINKKRFL